MADFLPIRNAFADFAHVGSELISAGSNREHRDCGMLAM